MTNFPFTAVLGQDELKQCLLLSAVDPGIGGVLALGDRGTGKTTTVRALGALLSRSGLPAPVVDLPLGATEDRVVGALDIQAALAEGERRFAPGLLAEAHGGFLYVDEINLLDDYLVDLLLDVAASGVNRVERDGISHTHPARFVLIGSGNPEEGDLRPQLEDRFGLSTTVSTIADQQVRARIIRARLAYDTNPEEFLDRYAPQEQALGEAVADARRRLESVALPDDLLDRVVRLCVAAKAMGHRAELVLARAARAHASLRGADRADTTDLRAVALAALRHRIPRTPYETPSDVDARLADLL
ncbi:magnesium chelatase subunit D/magnesium chelatase subunit I [Nonomuraea maritima]|uniref:Magnesium chelatase subunit D/magnesium chelatase subunit I n=1 Tax=Nonomuraea maritima TaxID=683260 RepID=A0A1G9IWI5_9ACTN|nr:ATP-binding protein [Nonomuraea maritima]SDL29471.1 magnesium chelatase subunit D/magnesium chelatase subunit I [Nonomuraea maritima]